MKAMVMTDARPEKRGLIIIVRPVVDILVHGKKNTACDRCGTFYDWGGKEPRIKRTESVEWD